MIVPFTNSETSYVTQFIGVVSYGAFTLICSFIVWAILKAVMGIRVTEEEEYLGLDKAEIGVEAYPEFGHGQPARIKQRSEAEAITSSAQCSSAHLQGSRGRNPSAPSGGFLFVRMANNPALSSTAAGRNAGTKKAARPLGSETSIYLFTLPGANPDPVSAD